MSHSCPDLDRVRLKQILHHPQPLRASHASCRHHLPPLVDERSFKKTASPKADRLSVDFLLNPPPQRAEEHDLSDADRPNQGRLRHPSAEPGSAKKSRYASPRSVPMPTPDEDPEQCSWAAQRTRPGRPAHAQPDLADVPNADPQFKPPENEERSQTQTDPSPIGGKRKRTTGSPQDKPADGTGPSADRWQFVSHHFRVCDGQAVRLSRNNELIFKLTK
jgi:hypothetical protein